MDLTTRIALEVACHEAIIRKTYVDSVGKNTWSVGLTSATGHDVDRYINNPQPLQKCLDIYVWALDNYANDVRDVFKGYDLTEAQFAAALSFHWNTGGIRRASWVKKWKAGDNKGARVSFMAWKSPPEIISRRAKERDLFFLGKWSNDGTMTEYTRLNKRRAPVWSSAKKIDVRKELARAMASHAGADPSFIPHEPEEPQPPTLSPVAVPKPKPELKSTTEWSAIGGLATTIVTAISGIDWKVAVPLIVVAAGFAFWIIKERRDKREEYGV